MADVKKGKKEVKFEEALKRLEEIVNKLESSEVALEESLSLFEEGIRLSKFCSQKLNEAEKKITRLVKTETGELQEEPFESEQAESLFEEGQEKK